MLTANDRIKIGGANPIANLKLAMNRSKSKYLILPLYFANRRSERYSGRLFFDKYLSKTRCNT